MSQPGQGARVLSDRQVDIIATRLAERLTGASTNATPVQSPRIAPASR